MRNNNELTPAQKLKSPFVAKVIFWNKSMYQSKFKEWNFRSDMCPNITKTSTIKQHLDELVSYLKTDILRNYGFELCTIFENMNLLSQFDYNNGFKKNIVLQCSEHALFYDNRDKINFDEIIKNNHFYLNETWDESVMLVTFSPEFIARMQRSFKEQAYDINFTIENTKNVYQNYRNMLKIN